MKVISIGTDRKILEEDSFVRERQIEYGKFFDELHIVIFSKSGINSKIQISKNVWAYPTNSKNKLFYFWDAYKISKNIILNSKLQIHDFVISTQDPFETGIIGVLAKIIFGVPLHIQLHTDFNNKYFALHSPLNLIRFLLAHVTLPFADQVRSVSGKVAMGVTELNSKVSILPISQVLKIETSDFNKNFSGRLLTVCRLEKEKDLETAISVFAKISKIYPEALFTIVGDGSQKNILELKVKSLGLQSKVIFTGWQNDLNNFYNDSDIYISTSLFEGYGMSVMEAALYGLPLVLTNAGIAEEYFKEGEALICEPKDVDCLYKSLLQLFQNNELRLDIAKKSKSKAETSIIPWDRYLHMYKDDLYRVKDNKIGSSILSRIFNFLFSIINSNKILRFIIAGGSVAISQIGILYILTDIVGLWYLASSSLSFVCAVIASFYLQKYWAFRDKKSQGALGQFFKFILVAIICIVVNTGSMYFWVEIVGIWYVASQFITGFIIAVINFLIYKFFIFNNR